MSSTSIYVLPVETTTPVNMVGSLNVDDHTRFRPYSVIEPRDVQLMQGTFTIPGAEDVATPQLRPQSAHGWYMSG